MPHLNLIVLRPSDFALKTLAGKKWLKKQVVPSISAWVKLKQERSENLYQRRKRLRCDTLSPLSKDVGYASLVPSLEAPSKEEALHNRIVELEEIIAVMSEKNTIISRDKFGLERFSNNPEQI